MDLEVCVTLRNVQANLGSLKSSDKWCERKSNLFVFAYFSRNCNIESDEHSCLELTENTPVCLRATCFEKPNPSARLVVEMQCIIKTAEDSLCKHTLGRATVLLSSLSQKKALPMNIQMGLRREAYFVAGNVQADIQLVKTPGFKKCLTQTFFVEKNVDQLISYGQNTVQSMLNLFFKSSSDSSLRPINKALHCFHCPYLNGVFNNPVLYRAALLTYDADFIPGGFFASVLPVSAHDELHMRLCLKYGCNAAGLSETEFTQRCESQLESISQILPKTMSILRAIALATVICASTSPYCVDHNFRGRSVNGEGGLATEMYDCSLGGLHGNAYRCKCFAMHACTHSCHAQWRRL